MDSRMYTRTLLQKKKKLETKNIRKELLNAHSKSLSPADHQQPPSVAFYYSIYYYYYLFKTNENQNH